MSAVYPCECKHAKAEHQGETYWCRKPGCACKRYTPDFTATEAADIVARALAEPDQPALSAQLARVEQERDNLQVARVALRDRCDLLEAELASARAELERLRYSGWIVARDGGRTCAGCGQEIRRGEAYAVDTTSDTTTHVHCREGDTDGN